MKQRPSWWSVLFYLLPLFVAGSAARAEEPAAPVTEIAIFAGGCFWCMEPPYDKLDGVRETISGYAGGAEANPTYKQVSSGRTGHAEVIKVVYDPDTVSYKKLLDVYWRNVDPTVKDRQFCDTGPQYRTAVFAVTDRQLAAAKASKAQIEALPRFADDTIYTEVRRINRFYPAEEYHQNYYKKNPLRYKFYRTACGRDRRLEEIWGE